MFEALAAHAHHHVEHGGVRPLRAQPVEPRPVRGDIDLVAVEGQRAAQRLDRPVVVDHEDAHATILPRTPEPFLRIHSAPARSEPGGGAP